MSVSKPRSLFGDGVLLFITAIWGFTFITVKEALTLADPFTFLALRFGLAALVATPFARGKLLERAVLRDGSILGVFLFAGFALQTVGLQHSSASRSAFFTGLSVLMVPFISIWLFRRMPSASSFAGAGLAAVGMYFLTGGPTVVGNSTALGDGLTLGCAACFAIHIALTEKYSRLHSTVALVGVQLWAVAILSTLSLPFVDVRLEITPRFAVAIFITGVLASTFAIMAQTWAQARTTSVRAAIIFSTEPVFASIFAFLIAGQLLGQPELIGGALIIAGVLVAEIGGALFKREPAPVS